MHGVFGEIGELFSRAPQSPVLRFVLLVVNITAERQNRSHARFSPCFEGYRETRANLAPPFFAPIFTRHYT